ncbi:MAG: hypothetical protein RH949_17025 [Coleofasciculus sp. A1-SPW-01]
MDIQLILITLFAATLTKLVIGHWSFVLRHICEASMTNDDPRH